MATITREQAWNAVQANREVFENMVIAATESQTPANQLLNVSLEPFTASAPTMTPEQEKAFLDDMTKKMGQEVAAYKITVAGIVLTMFVAKAYASGGASGLPGLVGLIGNLGGGGDTTAPPVVIPSE